MVPLIGSETPEFVDLDGVINSRDVSRGLWFPHNQACWGTWGRLDKFDDKTKVPEVQRPIFEITWMGSKRCRNFGYLYSFVDCLQIGCPAKLRHHRKKKVQAIFSCHNDVHECCNMSAVQRCPWAKDWIYKKKVNWV